MYSNPYKETQFWDEHIFINGMINSISDFEKEKIKISIYDSNKNVKDSFIGECEIFLTAFYFEDNHKLDYKWIVFVNSNLNSFQIQGFLKFSAHLAGPEDASEKLSFENKNKKKTISSFILPPQVQVKTYQLRIRLLKGEKLIKMDDYGSIDSYLQFDFGNNTFKTNVIDNNQNPFWGYYVNVSKFNLIIANYFFRFQSPSRTLLIIFPFMFMIPIPIKAMK